MPAMHPALGIPLSSLPMIPQSFSRPVLQASFPLHMPGWQPYLALSPACISCCPCLPPLHRRVLPLCPLRGHAATCCSSMPPAATHLHSVHSRAGRIPAHTVLGRSRDHKDREQSALGSLRASRAQPSVSAPKASCLHPHLALTSSWTGTSGSSVSRG